MHRVSDNCADSSADTTAAAMHHTLEARDLTLAYDQLEVARNLSVEIPQGKITCIVGANACGKSTLLRALARLLKPRAGVVLLDGESSSGTAEGRRAVELLWDPPPPVAGRGPRPRTSLIEVVAAGVSIADSEGLEALSMRKVASRLGILPQSPIAPEGITVADLVARGRYPHQKWFRQWTSADEAVVTDAMRATATIALAKRSVDELSGGQRQRVWIAMALAQGTDLMLLDEPTTYLDLAHQVEILDLLVDLNQRDRRTIVLVLHDLNQAARYSHHLIAMRAGALVAAGTPIEVITEDLVHDVFGLSCRVVTDEVSGTPLVLPIGRHNNLIAS